MSDFYSKKLSTIPEKSSMSDKSSTSSLVSTVESIKSSIEQPFFILILEKGSNEKSIKVTTMNDYMNTSTHDDVTQANNVTLETAIKTYISPDLNKLYSNDTSSSEESFNISSSVPSSSSSVPSSSSSLLPSSSSSLLPSSSVPSSLLKGGSSSRKNKRIYKRKHNTKRRNRK